MKVIALFPVKNERWIIDTVIPQTKLFADEILCLDGGSTDGTREVLASYGVEVRDQDRTDLNYSHWRQELLKWGRARGGTHFVWLDADETFTTNFLTTFRDELGKMKHGQKLWMQWLCLWKSPYHYREDSSIWSNLYKDFVFCDDGVSEFGDTVLHEGRTPGENNEAALVRIPKEQGAVLHFQFVPFKRFQIKQAYQRCREYILDRGTARRLNHRYAPTLDESNVNTVPIPPEWLRSINHLNDISDSEESWYNDAILTFFEQKGVEFFEPLQLWHIDKYRELFIEKTGREPKAQTYPKILVWLHALKQRLTLRS